MSGPTKVAQFGFSPEQLVLRDLRMIPEERVTAVLGVPAVVAGLGAGLVRSTFTNMAEAREMAYESNIIPTQRCLAEDIRFQLLTDFMAEEEIWSWRFGFDLSKVRVLADDEDKHWRRLDVGVRGGWAEVAEARREVGLEVRDADRVFLRALNLAQVRSGDGTVQPLAAPGNGSTGQASAREIADELARLLAPST